MDEHKPDLLSEIFDRAEQAAPPPAQRPRFEYPPEEEPPPADGPPPSSPADTAPPPSPPPDGGTIKSRRVTGEALLPWLCLVLGGALLVVGICLLQLGRMNGRLDEFQQTIQDMQDADSLRKENEQLRKNLEDLQEQLDQAAALNERLEQALNDDTTRYQIASLQKRRAENLFYIGQFMNNGDYPMAALAAALSADLWYVTHLINSEPVPVNEAQYKQYRAYVQELVDRGYLELIYGSIIDSSPRTVTLRKKWSPSENEDMAALGILWGAMDGHFIEGNDEAAAQYLYLYLSDPDHDYLDRVERLASDFTLEQFQLMKEELVASNNLTIAEDGTMSQGPGLHTDILYGLPWSFF